MKNFLKYLSVSVLSLLVMWAWFAIRKSGQPSEVVYKSIKATLNGTTTGTTYFEVTGWMVMDGGGNSFITGWALTGYLTGFTETDPVRNSVSWNYVGMSMTGDWNTAYSRISTESGNALFFWNNSGDYVLMSLTGNWNTAYGWWDHALAWYLTGYTETDPIWMANSGDYIPRTSVTTGMTYPWSDTLIPSEKAIYSLLDGIAEDLGDVLTTGWYYISGTNMWRTIESGNTYSIQYSTGWILWNRNQSAYAGFSGLYNASGYPYLAGTLSTTYIPYWNGTRLVNTNITYAPWVTYIGDPADGASISLQSGSAVYISPDSLGTQLGIFPNAISFDANTSRFLFNNTWVLLKSIIGKVDIQSVSWTYISGWLYDSLNNPYITWYTETDPIWITVSGNYCPITIYTWLTNNYIPYRSGNRFYNSNMLFYTNTHVWTYSAGDRALFNIRKIGSNLKWINITLFTGGFYDWIWLDIRASKPIITTTQDIWDPLNTTNIANNSDNNWWYFITNYVSNKWWYSSMISKWGIVGVANGASVSTSSLAGFYIMSWHSSLASTNGSWRIVMSWVNLSIQILSGWAWIEKWHFTP